jgi:hypothetical protein
MRTQEPEMRQASRDEDQHRSARLSLRRCAAYSSRARSHAASRRNTATYPRNPDRLIHSQAAVVDVGRAPHSWSHQLGSPSPSDGKDSVPRCAAHPVYPEQLRDLFHGHIALARWQPSQRRLVPVDRLGCFTQVQPGVLPTNAQLRAKPCALAPGFTRHENLHCLVDATNLPCDYE